MGLVLLLVVVALLMLLLIFVRDIEWALVALGDMARKVAANTISIGELTASASVLTEIREEALIQDDFLESQQ
jgi:hypothetical protein